MAAVQGPLFAFEGKTPQVHPSAWVAPTAAVIGEVAIGPESGVWFHCVLRGDTNFIRVGRRVNIQDGTIVHINDGTDPTIIGDDVSIGHAAIIHACVLQDHAFVGMGATVLDGAVIEEGGMLAARGLLTPGKRIGRNELWAGAPAKLMRVMDADERAKWDQTAIRYAEFARRMAAALRPA
jgi:carbonic anhydrase/acetyltransferase-like protein (isoleucine patch superfamily)